jgi:glycosyltransferase involved in cell wall biosynthesis
MTIGLPVFNGEKTIRKTLNSIISQTCKDYILLISDNASTDSTSLICEEFTKNDERIKYIRQNENIGWEKNFHNLVERCNTEYFAWISADDFWEPEFIEKNINFLESNKEFVGSSGLTKWFGDKENDELTDSKFQNFLSKIRFFLKPTKIKTLESSYGKNVRELLSKGHTDMMFGIYRTDVLKKSVKNINFGLGWGYAFLLNVLKFGKINLISEILYWKYNKGTSKSGMITYSKVNHGTFSRIFTGMPFTIWCRRNLGLKLFLRNFDYFIQLNFWVAFSMFVDTVKIMYKKILS